MPDAHQGQPEVPIGKLLRTHREQRKIPLRKAAEEAHVSPSTLSRIERGTAIPDLATLQRLEEWMKMRLTTHPTKIPRTPPRAASAATTVATCELHLRADPNLDSEAAEALVTILKSSYDALTAHKRRR